MIKKVCSIVQKEGQKPVYVEAPYVIRNENGTKFIKSSLTNLIEESKIQTNMDILKLNPGFILLNTVYYKTEETEKLCKDYIGNWKEVKEFSEIPVEVDAAPDEDIKKEKESAKANETPKKNKSKKASGTTKNSKKRKKHNE